METTTFLGMILMLSLATAMYTAHPMSNNQTDQIALFAFKESIIADPLGRLSSWNGSVNLCQWHGVKCGRRHQRVIELDLRSQRLAGSISPFIGNLSFLRSIYLQDNQFRGNHLTGDLPSNIGFMLPNLVGFAMGGNQLTGRLPASLSNISTMEAIDVAFNGLFGPVPVDLGRRMNELWRLNLGKNNLGTGAIGDLRFVDSLTNCTKLQILEIGGNRFGGVLPNSVANLSTQLLRLIAGGNQLVGNIPAGISNCVNLQLLSIENNFLSGSIPFDIGKLQNLRTLSLSKNRLFNSIPESIGNLTQIFDIYLRYNNLTGNIPQSLENIKGLQFLYLSFNNLGGSIPKSIGFFSSLIVIDLAHNSFNGSLPSDLGSLKNLELLDISDNNLSGELPVGLGGCLKLENLILSKNLFHGSIPSSFAALKGLMDLDLSQNNLSGKIPIGLEKLPLLEKLNLSFNNLEGEMPLKGSFGNTTVISIVGNKNLCGGIRELHLPTCPILESKKQNKRLGSKILIIVISLGLCFIVLLLVVALHRKRRPRRASSKTWLGEEFVRVSYEELLKATEGFSSINLLGVGSFGSVYKGIFHQNEKPIAVKVFNLERLGASKSFITECEALRKIKHRNLLKIITACSSINFEGNDFKALIFEFMQNGNLESWLYSSENTTKKLNLVQSLNIAIDVASALEYLHHHCETPIVHCDLKPSNILLNENMIAHVGDFGLAKFLAINISNPINGQTNSIAIKGSIGYVAPEYGIGGLVSAQGDIYSYGILLLEMLIRKKPTDEMFKDGLSLHSFCKMALPDNVLEIADSYLQIAEELDDQTSRSRSKAKMRECLISLVRIGVSCSAETPNERMDTSEIVMELNAIKQAYLGIGFHGERRVRMQLAGHGTSQLRNA